MRINYLLCLSQLLFVSCSQLKTSMCVRDFKEGFELSLSEERLDFQSMNCFPWDSLMLLAPYHYAEQVREETGIVLPEYLSNHNAEKSYLVFLKRNQVQRVIPVRKEVLDLSSYIEEKAFSASFLILDRKNCRSISLVN